MEMVAHIKHPHRIECIKIQAQDHGVLAYVMSTLASL